MKKKLTSLLLLTSIIFTSFVACSDDDEKNLRLEVYKTQLMMKGAIKLVGIYNPEGDCIIKSDNEQIVIAILDTKEDGSKSVKLTAVGAGTTTVQVTDKRGRTETLKVGVVYEYMPFTVYSSEATVEVEDAATKAAIEADLGATTLQKDNVLMLENTYKLKSYTYNNTADVATGKVAQRGSYFFEYTASRYFLNLDSKQPKAASTTNVRYMIMGTDAGIEHVFGMFPITGQNMGNRAVAPEPSNEIKLELEADLTAQYKTKYPDAKITSVVVKVGLLVVDANDYPMPAEAEVAIPM